jgi:UDP-glucose 4-epimerase
MDVLLTGPFGAIGTRVLEELLARGHRVTCFDLDTPINRKAAARYGDELRVRWGDITDPSSVRAAVAGQAAVIHLAAIIPPLSESKPERAQKVNVGGTQNVLDAVAAEPTPPRLVFPSSISVHGFSDGREPPCRADTPFDARDHYAGHKVECEQRVRASAVPWVIVRIGVCADGEYVRVSDGGTAVKMLFAVAPHTRLEYLHPKDAALAMANAIEREGVVGKTLFLGSGPSSQTTWRAFANLPMEAMGLGAFPDSAFADAPYYTDWMDTEESERLLTFQRHGLSAYARELEATWRYKRWLIRPIAPLIRYAMLRAAGRGRAT